jgi:hypothetical protein
LAELPTDMPAPPCCCTRPGRGKRLTDFHIDRFAIAPRYAYSAGCPGLFAEGGGCHALSGASIVDAGSSHRPDAWLDGFGVQNADDHTAADPRRLERTGATSSVALKGQLDRALSRRHHRRVPKSSTSRRC